GLLDEQKQAIRQALTENKLAISNVNAFMMNAISDPRQRYWHPSWIEPERHYRHIRIDHTIRALTLARELDAQCITTEPGGPVAPDESWSAALRLFVEMLKPVIAHAEKEGVQLLIEPEPGLLIEKADQFLELMRHIDSPAVGLNFDIGHFYCVGDDPAATVRLPNVFTAFADIGLGILATWQLTPEAFALGELGWVWSALFLMAASGCLYCAGMVFNDVFDLEQDKRERPSRPIPSGRVSRSA